MLPASFNLAGIEWTVIEVPGLGDLGSCERDIAVIRIRAELPPQVKVATFFHELVHAIYYTMGYDEHDERTVDAMGHLLHQFATTCKTGNKRGKKR